MLQFNGHLPQNPKLGGGETGTSLRAGYRSRDALQRGTVSGCLTLLEILEIYWNFFPPGNLLEMYKVYWKLPGSGRPFVINVPDSSCMGKQDQYDLRD